MNQHTRFLNENGSNCCQSKRLVQNFVQLETSRLLTVVYCRPKVWPKLDYLQQCKTHSEWCKVENMMLTCCQDHILTENIWFLWSKTSYSGDKRRCHYAGQTTNKWRWSYSANGCWRLSFAMSSKLLERLFPVSASTTWTKGYTF